ncbi:MAG TPA: hypothetical protein VFV75_11355 [Candidatus Polarisedimenticolaceae bacterium]|nr:hypothetical protein [Candidatus Polarisedimenticolaceae bacterium]
MRAATALMAAAFLVSPAMAEFGGVPDRFQVSLGGMAAELVTQATLAPEDLGTGAAVDFESLFNIPGSKQAARLDGFWHFKPRQSIDFGYVQFNRSGSREIDEDVTWGDFTFSAGAFVTATFDTRFPYAAWRWDFLQEDKVKISGTAGLSYMRVEATLDADGGVTGPEGPVTGTVNEGVSVQFPVPLVGLRLDWALRDRLFAELYTRFFRLDAGTFNGGMREASARLKWHFTEHVGAAIGMDSTTLRIKNYEKNGKDLKFIYDISGASAYLTLAF